MQIMHVLANILLRVAWMSCWRCGRERYVNGEVCDGYSRLLLVYTQYRTQTSKTSSFLTQYNKAELTVGLSIHSNPTRNSRGAAHNHESKLTPYHYGSKSGFRIVHMCILARPVKKKFKTVLLTS